MDFILSRYRNLSVLLAVIAVQLLLLAYQVKSNQDVRLIRVWTVAAVTPLARLVEGVRAGTVGFFRDYFILLKAREENHRLKDELTKLRLENEFLKTELATADRAAAMDAFVKRNGTRTTGARVIGNASGANSRVVFVDRGSDSGVQPGMAVISPEGIVGKVVSVFRNASQVMLVTDASFAAGVVSEKYRVHGTLKGQGHGTVIVDYVPAELQVDVGEKFFTSGDDRIFPRGMPVGEVKMVKQGRSYKEIFVTPYGFQNGLDEVLIVLEGVHRIIPESQNITYHMQPKVGEESPSQPGGAKTLMTDADRLRLKYKPAPQPPRGAGVIPDLNATVQAAPRPAAAPATQRP